jgi:hypothetical protein
MITTLSSTTKLGEKKALVGIDIFGKENFLVWVTCGVSERRTLVKKLRAVQSKL